MTWSLLRPGSTQTSGNPATIDTTVAHAATCASSAAATSSSHGSVFCRWFDWHAVAPAALPARTGSDSAWKLASADSSWLRWVTVTSGYLAATVSASLAEIWYLWWCIRASIWTSRHRCPPESRLRAPWRPPWVVARKWLAVVPV